MKMTEPEHRPHLPAYDDPAAAVEDPAKAPKFSADEIQEFRNADRYAGAAIVLLMAGVFTVGLVMYIAVAVIVNKNFW
jgi:hypothetical protein